jgi:hypothetical protein
LEVNKSDSIKELALALHKAHTKIKAAIKDSANPFFKSKYADLSSVIEAVKQPLSDCGIVYVQGVEGVEGGVAVETMLLHVSGEWISSKLEIPASKHDAQGYGSAITYGRRYGLQSMCGVPAEDDDGNAATASAPKFKSVAAEKWDEMAPEQREFLEGIARKVREVLVKENGIVAMKLLEEETVTLLTEEKVALWNLFNSKERSAMEPHKRTKKAA